MRQRIAVVYNQPLPSRYDRAGEAKAVLGVLQSVTTVRSSLLTLGYEVTAVPLTPPVRRLGKTLGSLDADLVFNLFEGFGGRPESEVLVPEYLEAAGIPFTGSPAAVLRLGLDKVNVKVLLKAAGIPTPDFQLLNPETMHLFQMDFPCIVKPRREDASHGITGDSLVFDFASLQRQVRRVSAGHGDALVEEFLGGREFNVTVMGNYDCTVLPASEIIYTLPEGMPQILTYAAKWEEDSPYYRGTRVSCPAEIAADEEEIIRKTAIAAYRRLGCRGYARVDMRTDGEGRLNVIEVNPNPDISPEAGAARQARAAGMTYTEFIENIANLALGKKEREQQHSPHAPGRQARPDGDPGRYAGVQAL